MLCCGGSLPSRPMTHSSSAAPKPNGNTPTPQFPLAALYAYPFAVLELFSDVNKAQGKHKQPPRPRSRTNFFFRNNVVCLSSLSPPNTRRSHDITTLASPHTTEYFLRGKTLPPPASSLARRWWFGPAILLVAARSSIPTDNRDLRLLPRSYLPLRRALPPRTLLYDTAQ